MSDKIQARREIEPSAEEGQLSRRVDDQRSVRLREFRAKTANTLNPEWYSGLRESDYMVLEVTTSQRRTFNQSCVIKWRGFIEGVKNASWDRIRCS